MKNRYKIITHVHTKYSHDSILPFFLLYWKCRIDGVDYVAITEHNTILGAQKFRDYCHQRGNKLKVILGEEIMTSDGEIIGLYINENITPMMSSLETIKEIKRQGGIVYVPHPYDEKRYKTVLKEKCIDEYKNDIDCIECHNGRNISVKFDISQNRIAEKYQIKKIIGADAHTVFEVGRNFMFTSYELDSSKQFLSALDDFIFYPQPCFVFCHTLTKIDRFIKLLFRGEYRELCQLIYKRITK